MADAEYAYPTIEEYEKIAGFKVNEAFRIGWDMARTTNQMIGELAKDWAQLAPEQADKAKGD